MHNSILSQEDNLPGIDKVFLAQAAQAHAVLHGVLLLSLRSGESLPSLSPLQPDGSCSMVAVRPAQ